MVNFSAHCGSMACFNTHFVGSWYWLIEMFAFLWLVIVNVPQRPRCTFSNSIFTGAPNAALTRSAASTELPHWCVWLVCLMVNFRVKKLAEMAVLLVIGVVDRHDEYEFYASSKPTKLSGAAHLVFVPTTTCESCLYPCGYLPRNILTYLSTPP